MLTVAEIRDVKFGRAMGGYKTEDVDVLLDKVEADYAAFERMIKEYELKIETLNSEIEGFKSSQSSIQNVLVSAQSLADKIVKEAKEKSEQIITQAQNSIEAITVHEKELSAAFEIKAQEQKSALDKELKAMIEDAQKKAEIITAGAEEQVKKQQMLFDKLKLEIASFKSGITAKYKEHIELIAKIPDTVPEDPKYIADVLGTEYGKKREIKEEKTEEISSVSKTSEKTAKKDSGFAIETAENEEEE